MDGIAEFVEAGGQAAWLVVALAAFGVVWALALGVAQGMRVRVPAPLWVAPTALIFMLSGSMQQDGFNVLWQTLAKASAPSIFALWAAGLAEVMGSGAYGMLLGAAVASWSALCLGAGAFAGAGEEVRWTPAAALLALCAGGACAGLSALGLEGLWAQAAAVVVWPAALGVALASLRVGVGEEDAGRGWAARGVTALGLAGAAGGLALARPGLGVQTAWQLREGLTPAALVALDAQLVAAWVFAVAAVGVAALGAAAGLARPSWRGLVGVAATGVLGLNAVRAPLHAAQERAERVAQLRGLPPAPQAPLPQVTRWAPASAPGGALVLYEAGGALRLEARGPYASVPGGCEGVMDEARCTLKDVGEEVFVALRGEVALARLMPLLRDADVRTQVWVGEPLGRELEALAGLERLGMWAVPVRWSDASLWRTREDGAVLLSDEEEGIEVVARGEQVWSGEAWGPLPSAATPAAGLVGVVVAPEMTLQELLRRCELLAEPGRCVALVGELPGGFGLTGEERVGLLRALGEAQPLPSEGDAMFGAGGLGISGIGGAEPSGELGKIGRGKLPRVKLSEPGPTPGGMSREIIQRIIRRNMSAIKYCYEKALQRDPSAEGKVSIKFTIGATGDVMAAQVASTTFKDEAVGQCVAGVVQRLTFPRPDGGQVIVNYPFVFKAE